MRLESIIYLAVFLLSIVSALVVHGGTAGDTPNGKPDAVINLATTEGVGLVKGQWSYSDVEITKVDFKSPGPDGQPTGSPVKTYDYTPKAGGLDYDDSKWEKITPESLNERRSTGRICFNWYRIKITIPEKVDGFSTAGSTVVFETAIDDYAEVWVNGELPRYLGQTGGSVISGWNAPNRLVVGRDIKPGQTIQIAVFGINGPISNPPTNFIWMREAKLDFYKGSEVPFAVKPSEVNVEVVSLDPAMDAVVGPNPKVFKLAEGFKFTEGPVWTGQGEYLLFSDPNSNIIYKYTKDGRLSVFRQPSGYSGADIAEYGQPGSNGLTLDPQGRLTIDEQGNHRVTRLEKDGTLTVLADSYEGKRLNSPNDLVYRSDGTLYFTDPPFGLPKFFNDPRKELRFSGVFGMINGQLKIVSKDLSGPNGIAFSPDEKYLYVGNWPRSLVGQHPHKDDDPVSDLGEKGKVIMRYEVQTDGTLKNGKVFFDTTGAPGEDGIDGMKVDVHGNLYVSGPGGIWVITAEGKHIGTIITPRHVHNMGWGGKDGKTLFLCAQSGLYMMHLGFRGTNVHYN